MEPLCVVGIDLAGVPHRPTGMCVLRELKAVTFLAFSDDEILNSVRKEKPSLVTIDAPLSLPPGRKSIYERNNNHFRPCDMELRRRKIRFFPITLGPMRSLTERGILLRCRLEAIGLQVVEVYPGGAQDVWEILRARHDLVALRQGLKRLGLKGLKKEITGHELDAATAALVGLCFLQGKADVYGDIPNSAIIMPRFPGGE